MAIARLVRLSPAQIAANQRRPATDEMADLRKFVDGPMTKVHALQRLPGDAREAEGHRRDHHRDARSHARRDCVGRHGSRQARVLQKPLCWSVKEARHLARRRRAIRRSSRRWAIRGIRATRPGPATSTSPAARSATCARFTSGPIVRSASGRRAFRGPPRCRPKRRIVRCSGTTGTSTCGSRLPWRGTIRCRRACRGISSSAQRRVVDYHPVYHPFNWRGWVDWGQGPLGDMGAHLIDHPFWSLKLGMPTVDRNGLDAVQRRLLSARDDDALPVPGARQHAGGEADVVRRRLLRRRKPEEIGDEKLNGEGGVLYIGIQGQVDAGDLRPEPAPAAAVAAGLDGAPKPKLPRIAHEEHQMNWIEAIKGKAEVSTPVRVRDAADRGDAAGDRVAARAEQDSLRRGEHADHERRRRE